MIGCLTIKQRCEIDDFHSARLECGRHWVLCKFGTCLRCFGAGYARVGGSTPVWEEARPCLGRGVCVPCFSVEHGRSVWAMPLGRAFGQVVDTVYSGHARARGHTRVSDQDFEYIT
ncbi:hypothetical protein Dimus_029405 [Dionaea muscipula]